MQIIKAKFYKNGVPSGMAYTYFADESIQVGDNVQLSEKAKGLVVDVGIANSEIESFKDKVKTIIGKLSIDTKEEFEKYLITVKHMSVSEYESKDAETRKDIDIDYVGYLNEISRKLRGDC